MGSTFNKSKTSFLIYEILSDYDISMMDKLERDLNMSPPEDITAKKMVSKLFVVNITDTDESNIKRCGSKMIGFCFREDHKSVSKKKVDSELAKWILEETKANGKEPDEMEEAERKMEIMGELSVGQHPKENYCACIVDFENKRVYVEHKGYMSTRILIYLEEVHKIETKLWSPFTKSDYNGTSAKDLFLSWLYLAMENEKKELETNKDEKLNLSNSIKFSDSDNTIAVKGNIIKFIDVYRKLLNGAKIEECNVIFKPSSGAKVTYSLKRNKSVISGYQNSYDKFGYSDDETLVPARALNLKEFEDHFTALVKFFEKNYLK